MNGRVSKSRLVDPKSNGSASLVVTRHAATAQVLKSILDSATEGYGRWCIPDGDLEFGDHWLKSLGYSRSTLKTKAVKSLIHPDDCALYESQIRALIKNETPALCCEVRFRAKSGDYRWFELRGKAIKANNRGIPVEIAATACDIQARRQQQDESVQRYGQFAATLNATEDCIFVVDSVKFGLVLFNKPFENLVLETRGLHLRPGLRAEEIVPDRASSWNDLFRRVLQHGNADQEYEIPAVKETYRLFAQPWIVKDRVSGICVFCRKITSQMRTEEALRKSEEKFSKAFREGPIALALTSLRDYRYLEVNDAFLDLTGYTRPEIIGKTPFDINLWVEPEQRIEGVRELLSTGYVRNREFLYRTRSGEIRHGIGSATIVDVDGEPCMLGVSYDISDRKRAIEALRESEQHLHLAIESGRMYAFEWDPVSDEVRRSKESEKILAATESQLRTERELLDLLRPEDKEQYLQTLRSLTPESPDFNVVFRLNRRDGNMLWLKKSGRAFFHPDRRILKVVGIATDVTEARESERILRELSRRLISTQEEERRRIARDLHDHIGQEMALLSVQAHRLATSKSQAESALRNEAQQIYKQIKQIATEVSKLSHRLHSTELDFLGLAASAERLCRDFSNQYGITMDFKSESVPSRMDINKTLCFYRVLQEALQNVAKHSHATRVSVKLAAGNDCLTIRIQDDGIGFDVEKARFESGLGLVSIRERLHLVGGQFTMSSNPGTGTTLSARVPI